MKIAQQINTSENLKKQKDLSFQGVKGAYDKQGTPVHRFCTPSYDSNKYNIALELVNVKKPKGDNNPDNERTWQKSKLLEPVLIEEAVNEKFSKGEHFDLSQEDAANLGHLDVVGYRFKLTPKDPNDKNVKYITDPGTITSGEAYSVLFKNVGSSSIGGPGYHVFTDSYYNPDWKTEKPNFDSRTHFNKAGGNIKGIISKLEEGKLDPYKWVMTTPLGSGDKVSNHYYWPDNSYTIAPGVGTLEDFKELQVKLFNKGKGHVNDGAYTSQCAAGFQMQNVLRWGEKSPFYNWFKVDSKLALGVLPDEIDSDNKKAPKALDNIMYRVVNFPELHGYDPGKPSYIQFYDKRLVDEETQLGPQNNGKLIEKYAKDADDHYEIKEHQDSVQLYAFQVDVADEGYKEKIKELTKKANKPLSEIPDYKELLSFNNFTITHKKDVQGANFWDGNVDLIKMNLSLPNADYANRVGMAQARNSLYSIGTYWTKTTSNALLEDVAKKYAADFEKMNNDPNIDKSKLAVDEIRRNFNLSGVDFYETLDSVEKNGYKSKLISNDENATTEELLMEEIANFPLESVGFASDLSALLSSPYITPRPYDEEHANFSKAEFISDNFQETGKSYKDYMLNIIKDDDYKVVAEEILGINDKAAKVYKTEIAKFVTDTLKKIENELLANTDDSNAESIDGTSTADDDNNLDPKAIFNNEEGKLTEFGKYAARLLVPDIIRYGMVKGLFPNAEVTFNKNTNSPEFSGLDEKGLYTLGIHAPSVEWEAEDLIGKLKNAFKPDSKNTRKMVDDLSKNLTKKLESVDIKSLQAAEAILDQTGGGLNWRFDAAKDVANLDKRRSAGIYDENGHFTGWSNDSTFEKCWDDAIDIWKNFIGNVRKENRSSYTIAEVTDLWKFFDHREVNYQNLSQVDGGNVHYPTTDSLKEAYWDYGSHEGGKAKEERKQHLLDDFGKYVNPTGAERMLYEETGATTGTNYSYFFSTPPQLVGQVFENGKFTKDGEVSNRVYDIIKGKLDEFYSKGGSSAFVNNSHVFTGNHDKPRGLFCMALDMNLYGANFADDNLRDDYKRAGKNATGLEPGTPEFKKLSAEAVAVADTYMKAFDRYNNNTDNQELKIEPEVLETIKKAINNLALGKFKGQTEQDYRRAKAFGGKDFEISLKDVMAEAEYLANKEAEAAKAKHNDQSSEYLNAKNVMDNIHRNKEKWAMDVRHDILKFPKEKYLQMWQLMLGLPGIPTMYSGDEFSMTGHEDPAKNNKVNNREMLPWHKLTYAENDPDRLFYEQMYNISSLPKEPGMSALADGTVVSMPQLDYNNYNNEKSKYEDRKDVFAVYSYNDRGSEVITVYSTTDKDQVKDPSKPMINTGRTGSNPETDPMGTDGVKKHIDKIVLNKKAFPGGFDKNAVFKAKHLEGTKYVDRPEEYVVSEENGDYVIRKKGGGDIELDPMTTFFYRTKSRSGKIYNAAYRSP